MVGVLLIGGESRRMGRPKHLLPLADGRPMGAHVGDVLRAVCDTVITVGGDDLGFAAEHCIDDAPGRGPVGGIVTAMRRAGAAQVLFMPGDMPCVSAALLRRLVQAMPDQPRMFAVSGSDMFYPFPIALMPAVLDAAERVLEGPASMRALVEAAAVQSVEITPGEAGQLININTPEAYDALPAVIRLTGPASRRSCRSGQGYR